MIDLDECVARQKLVNEIIETIDNLEEYGEFEDTDELLQFEDIFRSSELSDVNDLGRLWEEFEERFRTSDDMDDDDVLVAYYYELDSIHISLRVAEEEAQANVSIGKTEFIEA